MEISNTVGDEIFNTFNELLRTDEYSECIDIYSGSVITDEGKIIIYTSDVENQIIEKISDYFVSIGYAKNNFEFVGVKYSYKELEEVIYNMIKTRDSELASESSLKEWIDDKIVSFEISVENNSCCINILNLQNIDLKYCEKIFGEYSYIVSNYEEDDTIVNEAVSWKPGRAIYTASGGKGSTGFRCKLNGTAGFVTAGHMGNSGTNIYTSLAATEKLGQIMYSKQDGAVDFAFVSITNSNYEGSRSVYATTMTVHESHYVVSLPVGYTIYMRGTTSGLQKGTVVNYDYTISSGSKWLRADYESASGDSGGIVFANMNGDYCVIGVHDGTVGSYKYCTKYTTMKDYVNIVIY